MSTEKMSNKQGTTRMSDTQGTARMDTGTARMGANKASAAAGAVLASGQAIDLNGKKCVIKSVISGNSGEAVVYKVSIGNKPYALKLYKPNMPLSDTAKEVIAKIKDNPKDRIIRIYDFGSYNGQDFEVMEYAEGGTLEEYLKSSGAIKTKTKQKNIVKMINEGLQQLHGYYKVIYQDLKPENIYFRDAEKTSIVLADFGISSAMEGYDDEAEVTASVTDLYAAPELRHKANRKEVMATPSVDYFALGITMLELWLGEKPFKGIRDAKRDSLIDDEEVDLPIDMPDDYATIIKGLIKPKRKDRFGNDEVKKWLKGEALEIKSSESDKSSEPTVPEKKSTPNGSTKYEPLEFSNTEFATTPKELASLMEKYPDIGKTCLYEGIIKEWFKKANKIGMLSAIQNITSQYAKDKDSGLYSAILALDPERLFKSRGGKVCKTTEDIANAIMAESAYYMEDLKKPNANLYLYLAATEGQQGKEAADTFCKYFKEYSPKRALALVYLKLQSDGGITIGKKHYKSLDELKKDKDAAQIALIEKALAEKDSLLHVWLSDNYGINLESKNKAPQSKDKSPKPASQPVQTQPAASAQRPVLPEMVRIQGGTFTMGSPANEPEHYDDEVQHKVTVSSFYMGKYQVTQKEYQAVMGTNPSNFKGDNLPVEEVSWYDAVNYCNRLSQKEGLAPAYTVNGANVTWNQNADGYRLPTEAEWEYACRAGTTTPFSTGNNITTRQANYDGNNPYNNNAKGEYRGKTTPVGSFEPNSWGLYDMHGNVMEWCWDWYGDYSGGAQTDPKGASSGTHRVERGGSWLSHAKNLRSARRDYYTPSYRIVNLGFRLVRP